MLFIGIWFRCFTFGSEVRKQYHVSDGLFIRQQHYKAIDTDSNAGSWWHSVRQGANVVFVHQHSFLVATFTLFHLIAETFVLFQRIVQLRKSIGDFHTGDVELEAFSDAWICWRCFRQRGDRLWKFSDKGWLNYAALNLCFK